MPEHEYRGLPRRRSSSWLSDARLNPAEQVSLLTLCTAFQDAVFTAAQITGRWDPNGPDDDHHPGGPPDRRPRQVRLCGRVARHLVDLQHRLRQLAYAGRSTSRRTTSCSTTCATRWVTRSTADNVEPARRGGLGRRLGLGREHLQRRPAGDDPGPDHRLAAAVRRGADNEAIKVYGDGAINDHPRARSA